MWAERHRHHHDRQPTTIARLIAGGLAIGGTLWGLLLLPGVGLGLRFFLIFGPGYALTAAYLARTFSEPRREVRLVIWGASILIQGTWLIFVLAKWGPNVLVLLWWGPAVAASMIAAFLDSAEMEQDV